MHQPSRMQCIFSPACFQDMSMTLSLCLPTIQPLSLPVAWHFIQPVSRFSYFYISLSPSVLYCFRFHWGKCQCTHLSIGLADPAKPGYIHSPKWSQTASGVKERERLTQSSCASNPCSWLVIQEWSTWVMKPSGSWPKMPNPGRTCWACKLTLQQ